MYTPPPKGFRGFVWEPATEQEVVVLFGLLLAKLDEPMAVDQAWTPFPDCLAVLTATETTKSVHIEFEYRSSSFWRHVDEYDELKAQYPSAVWRIVCWHDDLPAAHRERLRDIEVMSLRQMLRDKHRAQVKGVVLNWYDSEPADPTRPEDVEQKFNWRAEGLAHEAREIVQRLRSYSASDYSVHWLPRPDIPAFTTRIGGIEAFKVFANGMIAFPCPRWPVDRRTPVLQRLAANLGTKWFIGRESRKKGCYVTTLLKSARDVDQLVAGLRELAS